MKSTNNEAENSSFLINISQKRRKIVQAQQVANFKTKYNSLVEIYTFNFLPQAVASTLLFPLNRLKVLYQSSSYIPQLNNTNIIKSTYIITLEVYKEEGLLSFFKGNMPYTIKIFAHITAKTMFFDRIKYKKIQMKKRVERLNYKIPGLNFILSVYCAFTASCVGLVMSYPFDLAFTRITAQIVEKGNKPAYKNISDCFHFLYIFNKDTNVVENLSNVRLIKYYSGIGLAIAESLIFSTFTLLGYEILHNQTKSEKQTQFWLKAGSTSLVACVAGIFAYPFDTLKRFHQLNGAKGYTVQHKNYYDLALNVRKEGLMYLYRGFPFYIARALPLTYIQYSLFSALTSWLEKKRES